MADSLRDHPDLTALLDRWEDIALDQSTWIALARVLDFASDPNFDTDLLSIRELADMARAGIAFVMQSLPDVEFRHRAEAILAAHAVASAIQLITITGARYSLDEARTLAHQEAFGL